VEKQNPNMSKLDQSTTSTTQPIQDRMTEPFTFSRGGDQPMDAHSVLPDDEFHTVFQKHKTMYEEMIAWVQTGRQTAIDQMNAIIKRVQDIENSLTFIPPESAETLKVIIGEQRAMVDQLARDIQVKDNDIQVLKQSIRNDLMTWARTSKETLMNLMHTFQWPTWQAINDFELPYEFQQLLMTPLAKDNNGTAEESSLVADLKRQIQELKQEQRLWTQQQQGGLEMKSNLAQQPKDKTQEGLMNKESLVSRRRRTQIPLFEKGTISDAQKWLNSYESLCKNFLHYSDDELVEELYAVLRGQANNWFTSLNSETKKSWTAVKTQFLHQFGGGSKPALSAIMELKKLQQGNMPISDFITTFKDLIYRSQIFAPDVQLDYFKEQVRPELCEAIILGRAKDLDAAMDIATEVEREWKRKGRYGNAPGTYTTILNNPAARQALRSENTYDNSSSGGLSSPNSGEPHQQNYQQRQQLQQQKETRRCYYCDKPGHLKMDCRTKKANDRNKKTKNKRQYNNNQQQVNTQRHTKEEDEDINVFQQFLNHQESQDYNKHRFRKEIEVNNRHVSALIDTGSSISTLTVTTVKELGLEAEECKPIMITYGNTSTQVADTAVRLDFSINGMKSTASAYVVQQQNEKLILGLDWMEKEHIILDTRNKTFSKFNNNAQKDTSSEVIDQLLEKYSGLVEESKYQTITNLPYQHKINTGNANPVITRDYRRSPAENDALKKEVEKMLEKKVIVASDSDWCSPVVLIKKPDHSWRFCVDYRNLNKVTIKDKFPLPNIAEILDQLEGYSWYSTLDLSSGFWQLPLDPSDAKKTAFVACGSLYHFLSMPYGVVNGPPSFSRLMSMVLKGIPHCQWYIDDVIIFSKSYEEHIQDIERILARLDHYNLKISRKKCQWFRSEVRFLGFLVSKKGIRSDPEKVEVVKTWPTPTSVKAVQKFLGFCAFYHRFLANLSDMAKPLYKLLHKDTKFIWTQEAEAAFQELKKKMADLPTLALPNPNIPFDLHTDASNVGLGAALVQNGRPIAFASRTLNQAESNYSTTEKECLAIVWALDYFYPYIYGVNFTIYTDHAALKSILSVKMPRGRIARWILAIQSYQFTIVHRKGKLNADADALSRLPEETMNVQTLEELSQQGYKKLQDQDQNIQLLKREVKQPYVLKNGLLCYKNNMNEIVPVLPQVLIQMLIEKCHKGPLGGHFGIDKTLSKIISIAYWKTMKEDVQEYIRCCHQCQIYKVRHDSTVPPMKPILPRFTGDIWAMDIAELPTSESGNKYILVFMEYLSKWAITVALPFVTTDQVAQTLLFEICLKLGTPSRIISDNGKNLISEAMTMVCKRLGIRRSLTSVEHPQTDGLVERLNRTIKTSLAAYVGNENKSRWDTYSDLQYCPHVLQF
jgi:hypothetical protein